MFKSMENLETLSRAEAVELLNFNWAELDKMNTLDRLTLITELYSASFENLLEPEKQSFYRHRVMWAYFDSNNSDLGVFEQLGLQDIYEFELRRLKNLIPNRKVPQFLKKILLKEYFVNLKGESLKADMPPFPTHSELLVEKKNDIIESIKELREKISTWSADSNEDFQGEVPDDILRKIFETPFYNREVKLIILKAFVPQGSTESEAFIKCLHWPPMLDKPPYRLPKRMRIGRVLEGYLLLAGPMKLRQKMSEPGMEMKTLPYYNTEVMSLIAESFNSTEVDFKSVKDDLREIFDPRKASL